MTHSLVSSLTPPPPHFPFSPSEPANTELELLFPQSATHTLQQGWLKVTSRLGCQMGGSDVFSDLITVTGFITALYAGGWIFQKIKLSPILGEIAAGVILGPEVLKLMSKDQESFISLLGNFGVTLMIFGSGMHVHFEKLKVVAGRSFAIATLGTLLPIAAGMAFVLIFYGASQKHHVDEVGANVTSAPLVACNDDGSGSGCPDDDTQSVYPDGFALGCALAPTSVGIALQLLTESKQLDSVVGQTIITSAFVDDIFSIVALVILTKLAEGDFGPLTVILPIIQCFAFLFVGGAIAFFVFPKMMRKVFELVPFNKDNDASLQPAHQVQLIFMFAVLCLYGYISSLIGSHLLGAFVAGMSFSNVPRSHQVWTRQMKRILKWLVRLFFGSSIAFSIPISKMFDPNSIWKGLICGLIPCIVMKIIAGLPALPEHRLVVGTAMVGRGEFAYLVAETAKSTILKTGSKPYGRMMSEEVYSIAVWALLCATIFAPFGFKFFLARLSRQAALEKAKLGRPPVFSFRLKVKGTYHGTMVHDVLASLKEMGLIPDNVGVETDGVTFILTTTVTTKQQRTEDDIDLEQFETIKHHIFEVLNDEDGQVMMVPIQTKKAVQIAQLKLVDEKGHALELQGRAQVSNPGGASPVVELSGAGVLNSKVGENDRWVCMNYMPLVVTFAEPHSLSAYTFVTGKDYAHNAIEPISWRLEGRKTDAGADDDWTMLHETDGYATPIERNTALPLFNLMDNNVGHPKYSAVRFTPLTLPESQNEVHELSHVDGQQFRPGVQHSGEASENDSHFIVVKMMGEHDMNFMAHIYGIVQDLKLDIKKAKMYLTYSAESAEPVAVKVLYCSDYISAGRPSVTRVNAVREKLTNQFSQLGVKGKAMVRTTKEASAPVMYGYPPAAKEGEHVGEFVFVYKHRGDGAEPWCPLTAILLWMHNSMHFDVINLVMDTSTHTGLDHVTIFVRDPDFDKHDDQDTIVTKVLDIFKEKDVPAHVAVHLHEWHEEETRKGRKIGHNTANKEQGCPAFQKIVNASGVSTHSHPAMAMKAITIDNVEPTSLPRRPSAAGSMIDATREFLDATVCR